MTAPMKGASGGLAVTWLADAATSGAVTGCSVQLAVAPGAVYATRRLASAETVVYVCQGAITHTGSGGERQLDADAVLVVPRGSWHGFENRSGEEALLLVSYTGPTSLPWEDAELGTGERDGSVFARTLHSVHDDASASADRGFREMNVSFKAAEGARATTFGSGRWPRGAGEHMWHRHPHADEVIYIYEGEAQHVTEGAGTLLRTGGLAYVPAGEWHTMHSNDTTRPLDAIFGYLGGASLAEAGYELRDEQAVAAEA